MSKSNNDRVQKIMDIPNSVIADNEFNKIRQEREAVVRKSNEFIRNFKNNFLSITQYKLSLYIITKAYTLSDDFVYSFNIRDFCICCGLDYNSGFNYKNIKNEILHLSNNASWIEMPDDPKTEVLIRLIQKAYINKDSGIIKIELDKDVKNYIMNLHTAYEENKKLYTQYILEYLLPMKSVHSMALYELLRSWADAPLSSSVGHWWTIDDLRTVLGCENTYLRYQDFRRFALESAIEEINEFSDLIVEYEPIKNGRSYDRINFKIEYKTEEDILMIKCKIHNLLDNPT